LNVSKGKLAYHFEESKKIWKLCDTWCQQSFISGFIIYSLISEDALIDEKSTRCMPIKYKRLRDKWHATSSWILWQYSSAVGKSEVWRLARFVCFHKSTMLRYETKKKNKRVSWRCIYIGEYKLLSMFCIMHRNCREIRIYFIISAQINRSLSCNLFSVIFRVISDMTKQIYAYCIIIIRNIFISNW